MATAAVSSLPYVVLRRCIRPTLVSSLKTTPFPFPFLSSAGGLPPPVSSTHRKFASLLVVNELESTAARNQNAASPPPCLSVKEKKDLASYAHSLGKDLKSQQIGKLGVTDTVIGALIETLEKNELLKLKIHDTCPGELDDVVQQLEETTGSVVVGRIGRTVILYRPSLTKLKAEEEKRRRAQRTRPRSMQTRGGGASGLVQGREPRKPGRF